MRRQNLCKPGGKWCKTMDRLLREEHVNARVKGLTQVNLTNLKQLDAGVSFDKATRVAGATYRTSSKDRGIMLNYCPWCGGYILNAEAVRDE